MKFLLNLLGTVLLVFGTLTLGYAGVSYANGRPTSSVTWSSAELSAGRHLARSLSAKQFVSVPRTSASVVHGPVRETALRIVIPRIRVDSPVVETPPVAGVWEVADWSVGHLTTSPNPGGAGNGAYSAHDDIKGEIFKREGELKPGDVIQLLTKHHVYTYLVTSLQTVDPSNISVLNPTKGPTITLISCTPYWVDTQRFIIQAALKSSRLR